MSAKKRSGRRRSGKKPAPLKLNQLPREVAKLDPDLRDIVADWSLCKRRCMVKVFARWAVQLMESVEMAEDFSLVSTRKLLRGGVRVHDLSAN
jgi:hypothetical protein